MDITLPPLRQQSSPAPWLIRRQDIDLARLVGAALAAKPVATIDEVVAQLASWGVHASGIAVAMWMSRLAGAGRPTTDLHSTLAEQSNPAQHRRESHWAMVT